MCKILVELSNRGFEKEYAEIIGGDSAIVYTQKFPKPIELEKMFDQWVYKESEYFNGGTFVEESWSKKLNTALSHNDVEFFDSDGVFRIDVLFKGGAKIKFESTSINMFDGENSLSLSLRDTDGNPFYFNVLSETFNEESGQDKEIDVESIESNLMGHSFYDSVRGDFISKEEQENAVSIIAKVMFDLFLSGFKFSYADYSEFDEDFYDEEDDLIF